MSDFSITARCPGCGQRFAPDDGMCCVPCRECGAWGQWSYCEICQDYHCPDCYCDGEKEEIEEGDRGMNADQQLLEDHPGCKSALRKYKALEGRYWKDRLCRAWARGDDLSWCGEGWELQWLRNTLGPKGLYRVRL